LLRRLRAEFASRLARDTLAVFLFSGLGRAVAMGKEMLVAALFGVGGLLDAYVLAFLIPSLLVNIFGAAFASALVPALGRAAKEHGAPRGLLLRALAAQAGLVGLAALGLALLPAQSLRPLAPFLAPERLGLVKAMQTALLPVFVLGSLNQVLAASVNYRGGFKGPALASTLAALATIAVIAAAHGALGVDALVAGVDAGAALEFCLLAWMLRRAWAAAPERPAAPATPAAAAPASVRAVLGGWSLLALGAGTLALASSVDNAIASTLGEGAVSALSYAWKLPSGFATLLGLTLSTVLLPYFSALAHNAPPQDLARSCRRIVTRLLAVCLPLAVAGALASPLLVALLFQRGRFDAQAAGTVSVAQACYFVQLPFYLLAIVTQRMLQALSRFRFLLLLQAGLVAVNALTSYALSRVLGVAGIALSSALMYALTAGISLAVLRRRLRARGGPGLENGPQVCEDAARGGKPGQG
jgi:putative peptidoglycan lipid II flippase